VTLRRRVIGWLSALAIRTGTRGRLARLCYSKLTIMLERPWSELAAFPVRHDQFGEERRPQPRDDYLAFVPQTLAAR
jgi:hypothetical protein